VEAVNRALPPGWAWTTIGEIAALNTRPRELPEDDSHGVYFVPMAAVDEEHGGIKRPEVRQLGDVRRGYTPFQPNDVLFAKITPCMENGKIAVVPPTITGGLGFGSTELLVLRPASGVSPYWISRYLYQSEFRRRAKRAMSGAVGQQRVPKDFVTAETIPLAPTSEQQRIADKIDELFSDLDAGVRALERVKRNLERYRASVLKAAVEGRLTAEWRKAHPDVEPASELLKRILIERRRRREETQLAKFRATGRTPPKGWQAKYNEPRPPDTAEQPMLPEGWCWARVEQVATDLRYGTSQKTQDGPSGVAVLRMGNILQTGNLDLRDLKYLPANHGEFPGLLLKPGDLLFNRTNSAELVGKTGHYRGAPTPCSFASYLIRIRLAPSVRPEYLTAYINGLHGRRWIKEVVGQTAGQANVNGTKLSSLVFALPPETEQDAIVESVERLLSICRQGEAMVISSALRASKTRQAILGNAFRGKLVPQDPNDEPVGLLLARIREQRQSENKAKATGRRERRM
jgi:type I restriction enzyme S subunit